MISARQVHFVEEHWGAIANRALSRIHREIPHSETLSDRIILDRVEDLFGHLGDWLATAVPHDWSVYERVGQARAAEHVHLHDLVRMLQLVRQSAVDYLRDNELFENTVSIRSESELEHNIDRFFDLVVYHVVKGYESELRQMLTGKAARAV